MLIYWVYSHFYAEVTMRYLPVFLFLLPLIMALQTGYAMDYSQLPAGIEQKILASVGSDQSREAQIYSIIKLRQICKRWNEILKNTFVADAVGMATEPGKLHDVLWRAIKGESSNTLNFLCKVYPSVIKGLTEIPLFFRDGGYNYSLYFPQALKILLLHGLSHTVKMVDVHHDGTMVDEGNSVLESIVSNFNDKRSWKCFDLLLKQDAQSDRYILCSKAQGLRNFYALATLLRYCRNPNALCKSLCEDSGACCKHHLRLMVELLVNQGASETWLSSAQTYPQKDCYHDVEAQKILSDHLSCQLAKNRARRVYTILYVVGGLMIGGYALYKYLGTPAIKETDDAQNDEENESESQDTVQDMKHQEVAA